MQLKKVISGVLLSGLPVVLAGLFSGCGSGQTVNYPPVSEEEELVQRYCGRWQLPPDPGALDKETWTRRVLPAMAPKLGLEVWQSTNYFQPEGAAISLADWNKLVAYYRKLAPEHLRKAAPPVAPIPDWSVFRVVKPAESGPTVATTTMVVFDSVNRRILSGSETDAGLYGWDAALKPTRLLTLPSPAVQAVPKNERAGIAQTVLTCIGTVRAVDQPVGEVIELDPDSPGSIPVPPAAAPHPNHPHRPGSRRPDRLDRVWFRPQRGRFISVEAATRTPVREAGREGNSGGYAGDHRRF